MDDFMVHRPRSKKSGRTPTKKLKSFSDLYGSKSPLSSTVGGDQLGHDQQLPVNPTTPGGSPLLMPGDPNQLGIGAAPGSDPSGGEFY